MLCIKSENGRRRTYIVYNVKLSSKAGKIHTEPTVCYLDVYPEKIKSVSCQNPLYVVPAFDANGAIISQVLNQFIGGTLESFIGHCRKVACSSFRLVRTCGRRFD